MISSAQNVSSTSAYQYALDYRALGWRIIPAFPQTAHWCAVRQPTPAPP